MSASRSDRYRRPLPPPVPLRPLALGKVVATPAALRALDRNGVAAVTLLRRHQMGDWGELCPEDHDANVAALLNGTRVFSSYPLPDGERVWLITEWDRSLTTLLLADDY